MKRLLVTTALAALIAAGPAFVLAQTADPEEQKPDSTPQQIKPEAETPARDKAATPASAIEFVSSQKDTDWLANSLIGRRVQNASGEDLGGISDLLLDRNGNILAVLVGVGGFLGIGGKDVAVRFEDLEFKKRSMQKMAGSDAREDVAKQNTRLPSSSGTGGDPARLAEKGSADREAQSGNANERKDPDHRDQVIVLNATKEQLETAPAFKRLGEAGEPGKATEEGDKPATEQKTNGASEPKQQ